MVDGAASLMAMFFSMAGRGFDDKRVTNLLDGGSHFYNTYETKDGGHVCVGSIEQQFYQLLVEKAGVDANRFGPQMDKGQWSGFRDELEKFLRRRQETNGAKSWKGPTYVSHPSYQFSKLLRILTTYTALRSSR